MEKDLKDVEKVLHLFLWKKIGIGKSLDHRKKIEQTEKDNKNNFNIYNIYQD